MSIGTRIRDARQAAGMTQEQLARAIQVTTATPSRWESDRNRPYPRLLCAIAEALGVPISQLTQDDDAEAATARAADILATAIQAALRSALSENRQWHDRRQTQAPVDVERRRLVSA